MLYIDSYVEMIYLYFSFIFNYFGVKTYIDSHCSYSFLTFFQEYWHKNFLLRIQILIYIIDDDCYKIQFQESNTEVFTWILIYKNLKKHFLYHI